MSCNTSMAVTSASPCLIVQGVVTIAGSTVVDVTSCAAYVKFQYYTPKFVLLRSS